MESLLVLLERLFWVFSYVALPLVWTETFLFWMVGLNASTSFRMFPPRNAVLDYPVGLAYAFACLLAMRTPYFVASDRRFDGRCTLGAILRPLTKRAGPSVEYTIMFARIWLFVACLNAATVQNLIDHRLVAYAGKVGCLMFIL